MKLPPAVLKIDEEAELHLLAEKDAGPLFQLIDENRLYLRKWLPWVDATQTIEDQRAFLRSVQQTYLENKGFGCSVWYQGQVAGTIAYHTIDWAPRKVEIGYWLGEQFQGHGLMTKACRTLINYAFNEYHLNKVEIRCAPGNTRSCAIPLRLGFTQEGRIRQAQWLYDHYTDLLLYGLLVDEWQG
ncbi:GNAT family N-acetyltransferase [Tengunoibacter tsumagoiensis]|uniref:Ribosomal-protein-serine acetyltransferase n=1 Tax=Tengunoibacter tsumagoiensis TaxID=2014871 RepID=A0A401ZUS5_9CHLR|nr:GNAT family protein [Tengunoibacter tsumagoiensis]GCE10669.1 ribosomal-protein-serine acetyltransferase [Tengunoibacter tsumagoiensis]